MGLGSPGISDSRLHLRQHGNDLSSVLMIYKSQSTNTLGFTILSTFVVLISVIKYSISCLVATSEHCDIVKNIP